MKHEHIDPCGSQRTRRRGARDHRARKQRVLHTRISDELAADIRQFADDLRVPASNLVRNVLEEVFSVVDSVSDDVGGLFDDLIEEADGVRARVREQAASRRRRSGRRGQSRSADADADFEDELRRDEAAEASDSDSRSSAEPTSAEQARAGEEPTGPAAGAASAASAASAAEPSRPRAAELFPDVLGWQPLVLNRDFACGRCDRPLSAGDSAFLGIGEQGLTRIAICGRCAGTR